MTNPVISRGSQAPDNALDALCVFWAVATVVLRACSATLLSPACEVLLDDQAKSRQSDTEQADDQDRREYATRVEILRGAHDELTEAGCRQEEFGGDHSDQRTAYCLMNARHRVRQGVGQHHLAPQRPLARAKRLRNFDQLRFDAACAFNGVVEYRKNREQENDQQL